ncbi:MAG: hypothetical protein WCA36_03745 [Pseudolabrys sp.]
MAIRERDAQKCFDAVGSKQKTLKIFTREEGGYHHCQIDNQSICSACCGTGWSRSCSRRADPMGKAPTGLGAGRRRPMGWGPRGLAVLTSIALLENAAAALESTGAGAE